MKNNNNKAKSSKMPKRQAQSLFRKVRDPWVQDATASSPSMWNITSASDGTTIFQYPVTVLPVVGVTVTVSGSSITWASAPAYSAGLPWLYNQARNFERYRVLNATLIFVSNLGSTATGRLSISTTTDIADLIPAPSIATSTGGKVFDLAQGASKEFRLPMDVDSSWKKVSRNTMITSSGGALASANSINDLIFSAVNVTGVGMPASTTVGNFFIEYDVEFKDPVSWTFNA